MADRRNTWSSRTPRAVAALSLAVAGASCGGSGPGPSAVILTLDTTRADALSCLGAPTGLTPHLDGLAAESVLYASARTVAPLTMPAHASMFTGLYPPRHTVRDNNLRPLPSSARTVAERAREHGYRTAAFVSSIAVDRAFGFAQGFELYDQPGPSTPGETERAGLDTVRAAADWLRGAGSGEPFLLWVHLFDPHRPLEAPGEHVDRAGGDSYLGEVAYLDDAVGALLDALRETGALTNTLLVVVADHGEGCGDHGEETHSVYCFDSTIRVPLLVRHPDGHRAGERSEEPVSVVDVYPTLIEALGLGAPGDVDGTSLHRGTVAPERGVYFESYAGYFNYGWSPLAGWADRGGAYLHSSAPLVFPPGETAGPGRAPLPADEGRVTRSRRAIAQVAAGERLEVGGEEVDPTMAAQLRALGYTAVGGYDDQELPHPLEPGDRPSPNDRVAEHERSMLATNLAASNRCDEALPVLRELVDANPRNLVALESLGNCLAATARWVEAVEAFDRLAAAAPERSDSHFNLGLALLALGRTNRAVEAFRTALAADPLHEATLTELVRLADERGDREAAARYGELLKRAWER